MSDKPLRGKNVAILVANGFNEIDMTEASRTLISLGATIKNISVEAGLINSWKGNNWGLNFMVDANINTVLAADFDMLYIPSGERSLAKLSQNPHTKRIIRGFMDAHKPVAIQGDAIALLAISERAENYVVCGCDTAKDTMEQAGAIWENSENHIDTHVLTGVGNKQNIEFNEKMKQLFTGSVMLEDERLQDAA